MKRIVFVVFFIVAFLVGGVMMMSVRDPLAPKEDKVIAKVDNSSSAGSSITNIMDLVYPPIIKPNVPLELRTIKTCSDLLYFTIHSSLETVQRIPRIIITNKICKKKLGKFSSSLEVNYLLKCLDKKDLYTDPRCKKNMILFRAFAINQKFSRDKKFVVKNELFLNDSALIHSLYWDMAVKDSTKLKPLQENIELIDELIVKYPNIKALGKAKLINLIKKDIYHGEEALDEAIFQNLEKNKFLKIEDRDIDELRLLLVLHKMKFYDKKEIKEWIEAFFLTYQEYNRTYYYRAFHSLVVLNDLKSAKEWVQTGIQISEDTDQILAKLKDRLDPLTSRPKNPKKLFPMYYSFTFLE